MTNQTLYTSAALVVNSDTVNIPNPADSTAKQNGCALYSGSGGNITVLTTNNQVVLFAGVPAGTILPVKVFRVNATGTTPTDIVALWY
jgi:hypothetical protein